MSKVGIEQSTGELINESREGFDALLNNNLDLANSILSSNQSSPFHAVGLGLTKFLKAALSQEDSELVSALATLVRAETLATALQTSSNLITTKDRTITIPAFELSEVKIVLISISVLLQSLVHVLTESYLEFMKAVYKLNRAHKGFSALYKTVFAFGIKDDDSIETIITNLNKMYLAKTKGEAHSNGTITSLISSSASLKATSSIGSLIFWNRSRSQSNASALKHNNSTSSLPTLSSLSLQVPIDNTSDLDTAHSLPNSRPDSPIIAINGKTDSLTPVALWEDDPVASLVISGAAFGFGLFGLIFSLLPPKLRKVISWFGFGSSNRTTALKLLTISATTSNDSSGCFAALSLVTYYCVVLLMSGWQNDEPYLIDSCERVLSRVEERFPHGTLWVLNRAKICRMKGDVAQAIKIIETALARGSAFREADSLLVFELSWCYLSDAAYVKAADSFLHMMELNSWSHSTYVFIAAGALLDLPLSERTPEIAARIDALFIELPSLIGKKRLMGEPPATEIYISQKLKNYKLKHTRWVAEGRLPAESKFWEVIKISPASELGHFWNTFGRAPTHTLQYQIDHLSSFSPSPRSDTASPSTIRTKLDRKQSGSSTTTSTSLLDLDPDEIVIRDLLLGSIQRSIGHHQVAHNLLSDAIEMESPLIEEKWPSAFARFELAVCTLQKADLDAKESLHDKDIMIKALNEAQKLLDSVFAIQGEYSLRSRLESRAQMLRDEVATRKLKVEK